MVVVVVVRVVPLVTVDGTVVVLVNSISLEQYSTRDDSQARPARRKVLEITYVRDTLVVVVAEPEICK